MTRLYAIAITCSACSDVLALLACIALWVLT